MASEVTFPPPAEKDTRSNHQSTAADEPQPHSNSQAPKPINSDPGKIPKWLKLPESPEYLNHVSKQVDKYRHQTVPLKKPTEYPLRIGGLNDTIYEEMEEELEAWENFYMPDRVEMKVIGAIDTFPSLAVGLQLIILAGKDGNIYAYENEVLHQVADCLQDLFENGLAFPGTKIYNYGECFEPMTDDEYSELMQSEEVKKMEGETREFIQSNEGEFLRILARIEEKENAEKIVRIKGSHNQKEVMDCLSTFLQDLKVPKPNSSTNKYWNHYTLEATVICICHYERTDNFYGASLSCKGKDEQKIMLSLSCLETWNAAVAHAVSLADDGGVIKLPQTVICKAFKRNWGTGRYYGEPPCSKCITIFQGASFEPCHRETDKEPTWPYGHCAETESLSKLLNAEQALCQQVEILNNTTNLERDAVVHKAKNTLVSLLQGKNFVLNGNEFQFFAP
ncbi:UNVERIFIED_CONTAM: hypothetical protein FKN15_049479 [Acipenser sinensis]